MRFREQNLVYVYYNGSSSKQLLGRLLLKNRQIFFEYDTSFINSSLEISPFKLKLRSGVIISDDNSFDGLFGVFNDSLPDGWGRLLLDRKLMKSGINPNSISPLDRLCFVGINGMGALSYEPENSDTINEISNDLDQIYTEIKATLDENDSYLDDLVILAGSSAGARPKVLLNIDSEEWMIKFRSSYDPKDIGSIEYAYHLMAKEAGLFLPSAKLFQSKNGSGYFGVKRFDRNLGKKIHMHTISGLLHSDHRYPTLDYETIMKATLYLTKDIKQCEIQFRNAIFNILSHNRDDHSKNFSFLMDEKGNWMVSPAYDLTFSSGPAGEHSTTIMGEGKFPTKNHLLKLALACDINKEKALYIIDQVSSSTKRWCEFANETGVSKMQIKNIENSLNQIRMSL
jgi:serine/threonine-protein kinase HipA